MIKRRTRRRRKGKGSHPERNLTEGSLFKTLLILSTPIVLANILQSAYQLIDTFWVGRIGADAVAAVSISFPITFLLISVAGGLAIAGSVLVALNTGRRDWRKVNHVSGQTLTLMSLLSIVFSILGYFGSPWVIHAMGASPAVAHDAVSYLQVTFLGLPFTFIFYSYSSLMRGLGEVKAPLYIVLTTVILNFFLDPLFILGLGVMPAYGVTGAAAATVVSQGVAASTGLYLLFSNRGAIFIRWRDLIPNRTTIKQVFLLGFPSSIEQSSRALSMMVMMFLVATFGTTAIASYGISSRLLSFIIIPALGFSMATTTLVGQNIGAGKPQRADDVAYLSIKIIFTTLTLIGIVIFFAAGPIVRIFVPNEEDVIRGGTKFIRILSLTFGLIGVQQVVGGALRGAGNTAASMVLVIFSLWVVRFPVAYLLSKHTSMQVDGIWWSFAIANIIAATVAIIMLRGPQWKSRVFEPSSSEEGQDVNKGINQNINQSIGGPNVD